MRRWIPLVIWCAFTGLAITAIAYGLKLRRDTWTFSQGAHFRGDINNAFNWGRMTSEHGLFHLYQDDENANPPDLVPRLAPRGTPFALPGRRTDYTPLRLAIASRYYAWAHRLFPTATSWQDTYEFTWPLLWANTFAEFASAVLVFLIIWNWRTRCAPPGYCNKPSRLCSATLGALLLWFNPAVIWNGHAWPQWDIWPVPFFLAAVLLATSDCWLIAGICLGIGAALKGQILLGAPILLLWPIFRGQVNHAFRLVAGFFLATTIMVLPWMLPSMPAIRWMILATLAMATVSAVCLKLNRRTAWIAIGTSLASFAVAWPWGGATDQRLWALPILLMICLCTSIRFLPRFLWLPIFATLISGTILLSIPLYAASSSWYRLGYKYGTEKFDYMVTGSGAFNIPRMLEVYEEWPRETTDPVTIPYVGSTLTFTQTTRAAYGICLLLCGLGAALYDRRRDLRFLIAISAPWLLFFVLLTQMHGRYTLWAAAIGSLLAGADFGLALLGVLVSFVSWAGIVENQLLFVPNWSRPALHQLQEVDPALGFVLLVIALIYLYQSIGPAISSSLGSRLASSRTVTFSTTQATANADPI